MHDQDSLKTVKSDVDIIRKLAAEYMEIARLPVMEDRRKLWIAHNDLKPSRPLVLIESMASLLQDEIFKDRPLQCQEEWARGIENHFRGQIHHYKTIQDDDVAVPEFRINWKLNKSSYGVDSKRQQDKDNKGRSLGFHWEPAIKDIVRDFHMLNPRTFSVDRESTFKWKSHLENVMGDIIPVRIHGQFWWTMGLTIVAIDLIGLENLMLYMYDQPEALHRLMAFLRDDHVNQMEFCEKEGLLSLNNDSDYTGSGSRGFTKQLPRKDFKADEKVRLKDIWGLSESQETVGVSPEMFAEFILPYQKKITERFGLIYYGCCEPVHTRIQHILSIRNLRSVSVSPWADEEIMSEALAGKYVYSRKPNPSLLSMEHFGEDEIRADLGKTLRLAKNCNLEIVMKDLHTTCGHPEKMEGWVNICRDEIRKAGW